MSYLKKFGIVLLMTLVLSAAIELSVFAAECRGIQNSVLRLHVIANSNEDYDQKLKLKVRDAVLSAGKDAFSGAGDSQEAERKIAASGGTLLRAAQDVIAAEGYDYGVKLVIDNEYFPTRTYEDITLPAGNYRAVKLVIGEGAGRNWWCVMFPPLCLPGAENHDEIDAVLTDGEAKLVKTSPKIDARFKVVEVYEKIVSSLKSRDGLRLSRQSR